MKVEIEQQAGARDHGEPDFNSSRRGPFILNVPWSAAPSVEAKGIIHSPSPAQTMSPETRDVLLTAIAKARAWIDDLVEGRVASLAEIAKQEGKVERHISFLAPLAFVSPRIVSVIAEGLVSDLKVTDLAKAAALSWSVQERRVNNH